MTASPPNRVACFLGIVLLEVLLAQAVQGQPRGLPRLNGSITLDGRVAEPAWEEVDPLPMTMSHSPYGSEPPERTDVRVAYDDEHL